MLSARILPPVAALLFLLLAPACRKHSSPQASPDTGAGSAEASNSVEARKAAAASSVEPEMQAELKAANAFLSQFVTRTGVIPGSLKEAQEKGALPATLTAPAGMKLHYDPTLPSIGFVPAK